jgi:hypothetical protein
MHWAPLRGRERGRRDSGRRPEGEYFSLVKKENISPSLSEGEHFSFLSIDFVVWRAVYTRHRRFLITRNNISGAVRAEGKHAKRFRFPGSCVSAEVFC